MTQYRVSVMWNQSVMGVSETYYTRDASPVQAAGLIQSMLRNRADVMFPEQFFVGVRISQFGTKRRSVVMLPGEQNFPGTTTLLKVPIKGTAVNGAIPDSPDQLRATMQMRLTYDVDRTTIRYLSGIPDQVSLTEPATLGFPQAPTWGKAWASWASGLVNDGWCIAGRNRGAGNGPFSVVGVTQQAAAPLLLGIALTAATAPALLKGQRIILTGFRPAKGVKAATLNGTWYVDSINTTLLPDSVVIFLRGSAGINPDAQRFTDKTALWVYNQQLFPILDISAIRVGIHKRGRPSLAPRGRRLTRTSLDA